MEVQNGDASRTENADSSPSTESNGKWLSSKWLSKEWLSEKWLPGWVDRRIYLEQPIVVALFTVVLIAGVAGGGYYWYQEVQETRRQAQMQKTAQKLSNPIYWPSKTVTTLDAKFRLVTKWIPADGPSENVDYESGEMKYKLRVYGYPNRLENAWSSEFSSSYFVTIQLLDKDGFKVTSIKITLDKLTRTVNPKGEGIGFSVQGSETMSLHTYPRIDDWKITWNL